MEAGNIETSEGLAEDRRKFSGLAVLVLAVGLMFTVLAAIAVNRLAHDLRNAGGETGAAGVTCPPQLVVDLGGPVPGLDKALVPGEPLEAVVCRYAGLSEPIPPRQLVSSAPLKGSDLAAFVQALNSARRVPQESGGFSCPNDTGGRAIVEFVYLDGSRLRISVERSGCRWMSNGMFEAFNVPQVANEITRLVGLSANS